MTQHKKSASCSDLLGHAALVAAAHDTDYPESDEREIVNIEKADSIFHQRLLQVQPSTFPLPSACLFSKSALNNERATEHDIIRFMTHGLAAKRMALVAGVLETLHHVMNGIQIDDIDDSPDDETLQDTTEDVAVLGLGTCKVALWDLSDSHLGGLSLMVFVSSCYTDTTISNRFQSLRQVVQSDQDELFEDDDIERLGERVRFFIQDCFDHRSLHATAST